MRVDTGEDTNRDGDRNMEKFQGSLSAAVEPLPDAHQQVQSLTRIKFSDTV